MPAKTPSQQMAMAMALHSPEKLYKRNRGLLNMSKEQLREFASTKRTGLPEKAKPKKKRGKGLLWS